MGRPSRSSSGKPRVRRGRRPAEEQASDPERRVLISIAPSCRDDPAQWRGAVSVLKSHGLNVLRELKLVGMVSGTLPRSKVAALESESCVVRVSPDERRHVQ